MSITASKDIIRRGPRLAKAFSPRSGSRAMTPRTSTVTSPIRSRSPSARFMRRSAASSTTAPQTPSRLRQRVGQRAAVLQLERAVERIGLLDRLELDQGRPAVGLQRPRHGAAVDPAHELAALAQEGHLLGRRLAIEQRDRDVAAQDLARIGAQAFLDGAAERQDGGDRGDAQRQAGDEQAEAAQAAAHLAPGEARMRGSLRGTHCASEHGACVRRRPRGRRRCAGCGRSVRPAPCRG